MCKCLSTYTNDRVYIVFVVRYKKKNMLKLNNITSNFTSVCEQNGTSRVKGYISVILKKYL